MATKSRSIVSHNFAYGLHSLNLSVSQRTDVRWIRRALGVN